IAVLSALCAVANAGVISPYSHGYGLGYGAALAPAYAAPAVISHAPIIKSYAAPIVHAPIVKTIAPLATSYANTYKVATKSYPVVAAAPIYHAAPAVVAAPALHTTSTYHGGYGGYGLGGYSSLGYSSYGHGYGLH
ncbi:hypothetical protein KR222_007514, partial [Zaprionus bogoriensis]